MKTLFQEKLSRVLIVIALILTFIAALIVYLNIGNLSYPLVLHISPYGGVDLTGSESDLWGAVIMAAIVIFLNIVLASRFFHRERILVYILLATAVFVAVLTVIATGWVIAIN